MATNSVLPPFPTFKDINGQPLENGRIFIGQPGFEARTTPKASFFDLALTIPTGTATGAAIVTQGGYPVRNGAPAVIYVDGDFAITVTDRNGVAVYTSLTNTLAINVGGAAGPVQAADGNLSVTGLGFENEVNTGFVRNGTGSVQSVIQGTVVSSQTVAGTSFVMPVSGAGLVSGINAAFPTVASLEGLPLVAGDVLYATAADTLARLAKGTAGQALTMNAGATAPEWAQGARQWRQTQALTSGSSKDFTGLPANLTAFDILIDSMSATVIATPFVRLGTSGGIVATGYTSVRAVTGNGVSPTVATGGGSEFVLSDVNPASGVVLYRLTFRRIFGLGTHFWMMDGIGYRSSGAGEVLTTFGRVDLGAELTQARLELSAGAFDLGNATIAY